MMAFRALVAFVLGLILGAYVFLSGFIGAIVSYSLWLDL